MDTRNIMKILSNVVESERISDREYDRIAYSRDLSAAEAQIPSLIVKPVSVEEVSYILKTANKLKIKVYVRGAGTSHWGCWLPYKEGILLDTTEMDEIIEVNDDNLTATVESGCTWYKLDLYLRKRGLTHLSSEMGGPAMTIGGGISKAGGGPYGTCKFGFHGQYDILGFEVVLPTGEIVRTGSGANTSSPSFKRYGLGPDMTGLFIGAEGVFGVITKITLRVRPLPTTENFLFYNFKSWKDVVKVGDALTRPFGDEPAFSTKFSEDAENLGSINAQIQVFGYDKLAMRRREKKIKEICENNNGKEGDLHLSQIFFQRALTGIQGIFKRGVWHYGGCGSIPIKELVSYAELWKKVAVEKYKFHSNSFNAWAYPRGWTIYVHFRVKEPVDEKVLVISENLHTAFVEKGIVPLGVGGRDGWMPFIKDRLGSYYELMKRIKNILDPNNIMQPGIIFM